MKSSFFTICCFLLLLLFGCLVQSQFVPPPTFTPAPKPKWTFRVDQPSGLLLASSDQLGITDQLVCSSGFSDDTAQFMCRRMLNHSDSWSGSTFSTASAKNGTIAMRSVRCRSYFSSFDQCSYYQSQGSCTLDTVVAISCRDRRNFEFDLVDNEQTGVKNILMTRPVNPPGTSPLNQTKWRQVCGYGMTQLGAQGICNIMNLPATKASDYTVVPTSPSGRGFWLSRVNCPSGIYSQSFKDDCSYTEEPKEGCDFSIKSPKYGYSQAVVLMCQERQSYTVRIQEKTNLLLVNPAGDNSTASSSAVCNVGLYKSSVQNICKLMGLPYSGATYSSMTVPSDLKPFSISRLSCPSSVTPPQTDGDAPTFPTLDQCSYRQTNYGCDDSNALTINCAERIPYEVSIDPKTNIVLVKDSRDASSPQKYLPVCNRGLSVTTANLICSLLGKPSGDAQLSSTSLESSGYSNFAIADIYCSSRVSSFDQCSYSTQNVPSCSDNSVAVLKCEAPGMYKIKIDENSNLLAAKLNSNNYNMVCYDTSMTTTTARSICRMLGMPYSSASYGSSYYPNELAVLSNVRCPSTASNFSTDCDYTPNKYCTSRRVRLYCRGDVPHSAAFKLDSSSYGLVLYRPTPSSQWGTICSTGGSSSTTAQKICQNLYPDKSANFSRAVLIGLPSNKSSPYKMLLSSFYCSSKSSSLNTCTASAPARSYCKTDLVAICVPKYEFKLVDGYLLSRLSPSLPWTPIADNSYGAGYPEHTADIICQNILKKGPNVYGEFFEGKWNSSEAIGNCPIITSFSCPPSAQVWADCRWYTSSYSNCYSNHLGLRCLPKKPTYQVSVDPDTHVLQVQRNLNDGTPTPVCYQQMFYPMVKEAASASSSSLETEIKQDEGQQQQQEPAGFLTTADNGLEMLGDDQEQNVEKKTSSPSKMITDIFPYPQNNDGFARYVCKNLNLPYTAATQLASYDKNTPTGSFFSVSGCPGSFGPYYPRDSMMIKSSSSSSNTFSASNCSWLGPSPRFNCTATRVLCRDRLEYQFSLASNGLVLVRPIDTKTGDPYGQFGTVCTNNYYPRAYDVEKNQETNLDTNDDQLQQQQEKEVGRSIPVIGPSIPPATICRLLGLPYTGAISLTGKVSGNKSMPIYISNLYCPKDATNSSSCSYKETNSSCSHNNDLAVVCKEKDSFDWKLDTSFNEPGTPDSDNEGFLMVRPQNNRSAGYGTVCPYYFGGSSTANTLCGFLGLPFGLASWSNKVYPSKTMPQTYLSRVSCYGAKNFSTCDYSEDTTTGCSFGSSLFLSCKAKTEFDFSITPYQSLVVARPRNLPTNTPIPKAWKNTVCAPTYSSFTSATARALCQAQGLPYTTAYGGRIRQSSIPSNLGFSAVVSSLSCLSNYTNISKCSYREMSEMSYCGYYAQARCSGSLDTSITKFSIDQKTNVVMTTNTKKSSSGSFIFGAGNPQPLCDGTLYTSTSLVPNYCQKLFPENNNRPLSDFQNAFVGPAPSSLMQLNTFKFSQQNAPFFENSPISSVHCSTSTNNNKNNNNFSPCTARVSALTSGCKAAQMLICTPTWEFVLNKTTSLVRTRPASNLEYGTIRFGGVERSSVIALCNFFYPNQKNLGAIEYVGLDEGVTPKTPQYVGYLSCPSGANTTDLNAQCKIQRSRAGGVFETSSSSSSNIPPTDDNDDDEVEDIIPVPPSSSTREDLFIRCESHSPSINEYQLQVGDDGLVQVRRFSGEPWGAVCGPQPLNGITTAQGICNMVGKPSSGAVFSFESASNFDPSSSKITSTRYISQLSCPATAKSLADCDFTNSSKTCHSPRPQFLKVICQERTVYKMRITPDPLAKNAPLLQFQDRSNSSAPWQPVCADGFAPESAPVICQRLGLPSSAASWARMTSVVIITSEIRRALENAPPFAVSRLDCSSSTGDKNDATSDSCSYWQSDSGCQPYERVYLQCKERWPNPQFSATADTSSNSIFMMKPNNSNTTPWGGICASSLPSQSVAATICGPILGLPSAGATFSTVRVRAGSYPLYARNFNCPVWATSFDNCSWIENTWGCSRSSSYQYLLSLECRDKTDFTIKIDDQTGAVLVNSLANAAAGAPWNQFLCDRGISQSTAMTLCRILGKPFGNAQVITNQQMDNDMTVGMSLLRCPDNANSLFQCSYVENDRYCNTGDGVQIVCQSSPKIEYSIATNYFNILRYRRETSTPWNVSSFICYAYANSAGPLCSSMGLPSDGAYLTRVKGIISTPSSAEDGQNIAYVDCPEGVTRSMQDCRVAFRKGPCPSDYVYALYCPGSNNNNQPTTTPVPGNDDAPQNTYLFEINSPNGQLTSKIYTTDDWNSVCTVPSFKDSEATQICKILGYKDVSSARGATLTNVQNATFNLAGVSCKSTNAEQKQEQEENSFSSCASTSNISSSCNDNTVAAVYCNSETEYYSNGYFFKQDPVTNVVYFRSASTTTSSSNQEILWNVLNPYTDGPWSVYVARTLCATLGQGASDQASLSSVPVQLSKPMPSTLLQNLGCPPNSNGDFGMCWYLNSSRSGGGFLMMNNNQEETTSPSSSTTQEAVALNCPLPHIGAQLKMRFSSSMRVEVATRSADTTKQSAWGTVCDAKNTFSMKEAYALCTLAGYDSVASAKFYRISGRPTSQNARIKNLKCPPITSEFNSIDQCTFDWASQDDSECNSNNNNAAVDIALDCGNSFTSPISLAANGLASPTGDNNNNNNNNGAPSDGGSGRGDHSKDWIAPVAAVLCVAAVAAGAALYIYNKNKKSSRSADDSSFDYRDAGSADGSILNIPSSSASVSSMHSHTNNHQQFHMNPSQFSPSNNQREFGPTDPTNENQIQESYSPPSV